MDRLALRRRNAARHVPPTIAVAYSMIMYGPARVYGEHPRRSECTKSQCIMATGSALGSGVRRWDVYHRYGLLTDAEVAEVVESAGNVPELKLRERAFEIVLARQMRDDGLQTQWFERHRSAPITGIPAHWPDEYRAVVEKRIELIERNRNIGLIERPECKRRWLSAGGKTRNATLSGIGC
jgi:hypothetical protein